MRVSDFHYSLPEDRIAQQPAPGRDESRLMVLSRPARTLSHRRFPDLAECLGEGDVIVMNNSSVIPARLFGLKGSSGGRIELLLLEEVRGNEWWAMIRPGKRVREGTRLELLSRDGQVSRVRAILLQKNKEGHGLFRFEGCESVTAVLEQLGEMPLPPYIERTAGKASVEDYARYQTVIHRVPGSVAAPTAGLHFTGEFLDRLRQRGVSLHEITLHVGLGTFAPVKADRVEEHVMHEERFEIPSTTAEAVSAAKREGRRVVAVGTTSVRALEHVANEHGGRVVPGAGRTRLLVYPPWKFRIVDALLTNFHLPSSTLLMLVSAFAAPGETWGRDWVLEAYGEAVRQEYRFYSYGDAMFIE